MQTIKYRREIYKLLPEHAVCVELGVAEGYFAQDILSWGVARLYAVDMWESSGSFPGDAGSPQEWHDANYNATVERLKPYGERAVILRGPTTAMAAMIQEPLDFVNVDACHSYACVKADIEAYWPKLKKGGVMSFHDYEMRQYGVKQAVQDFFRDYYPGLMQQSYGVELLPEDKQEDAGAYIIKR